MDGYGYEYRRPVDSVSLPSPELPAGVGRMVVERGHGVAAEGIPLRTAPQALSRCRHVTARQPAPGGREGAAPARPEAGGQGGGRPRGDRRQVGYPGPIGQYPGLHRPCQAPGGPDRTADPEGRDDPAPREGAPDIRAAHPLDIEGKRPGSRWSPVSPSTSLRTGKGSSRTIR